MTLYYGERHELYSLPNIITMMKSGRMSWVGHTACMEARTEHTVLVKKLEGNRPI
jgi:hypothetical protein